MSRRMHFRVGASQSVPIWSAATPVLAVFARRLELKRNRLLRLQLKKKTHVCGPYSFRSGFAMHSRSTRYAIQAFITEHHTIGPGFGLQVLPTLQTLCTADLEDVGEISCEGDT